MKSTVEIAQPPEVVFEYLEDGHKTSTYMAREFQITPVLKPPSLDGHYRLGTQVKGLGSFFALQIVIMYKVVTFEPGRAVLLRSEGGRYNSEVLWLLKPNENGGTTLSLEVKVAARGGLIGLLTNTTIAQLEPIIGGFLDKSLLRLKNILEKLVAGKVA